jgi:hypothetical protein
MSRAQLRAIPKRKAPSLSLVKKALRLYASPYASKETRRRNAMKWLASVAYLGPSWVLAGRREVSWGAKQQEVTK